MERGNFVAQIIATVAPAGALAAALLSPSPAAAHNTACKHEHVMWTRVECRPPKADCVVGSQTGVCLERVKSAGVIKYRDCFCVTALGDYLRAGAAVACQFEDFQVEPGGQVSCSFVAHESATLAIWAGEGEEPVASVDTEAVTGTLDLTFGEGEDPTQLPVSVTGMTMELAPVEWGTPSLGVTRIAAAPGEMVFNLETGELSGPALSVTVDNDADTGVTTELYLGGILDPETQMLQGNIQLTWASAAVPPPQEEPPPVTAPSESCACSSEGTQPVGALFGLLVMLAFVRARAPRRRG